MTPRPALAVDGQVAITQAKAMAGGVTPGDAPGFPVSINLPGSYVLSSGLTVPDANTSAIEINESHVTVDLNGFAILGPADCSGGFPCVNEGVGVGIVTPAVRFNITIRGGTIQGMGGDGVRLRGDSHVVEYLHVRSNGVDGILVIPSEDLGGSLVQHNTVQRYGLIGIQARGSIAYNTVDNNEAGIVCFAGIVEHNFVNRNVEAWQLTSSVNYIANTLSQNQSILPGGHNGGQNLCNGTTCPGAQF